MARDMKIEFAIADRVNGQEVSPAAIPLGLLKSFVEDVQTFVRGSKGEIDSAKLVFAVKDGSFELQSQDNLAPDLALWDDIDRLKKGSLNDVDRKRAEIILKWQRDSRDHPGRHFRIGDGARKHYLVVDQSSIFIEIIDAPWVVAERYYEGTLEDVGGKTPNIHIRLKDGKMIKLDATREQIHAQEHLRVYHPVLVRVSVEENLDTGEVRNARFLSFSEYDPRIDPAQYEAAIEAGRKAWADVEDPAAWVRAIRGDDN